ncbi:DUF6188 family protein [Nocardia sp. NPDC055321]
MELKIIGHRVSAVNVGYTVTIELGPHAEFDVKIESDLIFRTPAGESRRIASDDFSSISSELDALVGSTIVSANADESQGLTVRVDTGAELHVPVDPDFEAWTVVGVDGSRVISLPGGGFAIWDART